MMRTVCCLGLLAVLAIASADEGRAPNKEAVAALVRELDNADAGKREEAVRELIKLGPSVLPLLPAEDEVGSEPHKKHLRAVRKALRDVQVQKELPPVAVSMNGSDLTVEKALAELTKQANIKVEDRRRVKPDRPFSLDLKSATFWQALDAIARASDAEVSLYQRDGVIALVDGPNRKLPVSYHGPFRVVLQRKVLVEDLVADSHQLAITVEVAWEPRFRPYFLETIAESVAAKDDSGRETASGEEGGKAGVEGKLAATVDLRLPAPARSARKLDSLRGEFLITGAGEMLTFTFATLAQLDKDPEARRQKQKNVTVKLAKPALGDDLWTVEVQLEYPPGGPKFESFQSWIGYNEIELRKTGGEQRFPNTGGYSVESSTANRATVRYHFIDKKQDKLLRGSPADWRVVYKTPGVILEAPVPFEFKDVALP
jgi:hypothetical protein